MNKPQRIVLRSAATVFVLCGMKTRPLLLAALAVLLVSGCFDNGQKRESAQPSERAKREQATLLELASRHNACADWLESLPDRGFGKHFTVDLATALVRTNGQPVAMQLWLQDVSEKDGVFTAHFEMFPLVQLHLALRCTAEQANNLLRPLPEKLAGVGMRFAAVIKVDSVVRPALAVVTTEEGTSGSIGFDSAPDTFYAKGTCIDPVYLEWTSKK